MSSTGAVPVMCRAQAPTSPCGGGPRDFTAVTGDVGSVHWLDNDEELNHTYDARSVLLCVDATGYPYGVDRVVRVAEVR